MRYFRLAALSALFLAASCSAPRMMTGVNVPESPQPPGAARVVFYRDALFGSAIPVYVYETSRQDPEFLGALLNGAKMIYDGAPGQHVFMLTSDSAHFLVGNLAPETSYAVEVTPKMGFWSATMNIRPLRRPFSAGTARALATAPLLRKDDAAERWHAEHYGQARAWTAMFQDEWSRLTEEERKARTLNTEDGE